MDKRPALGKGLSALIPDAPEPRMAPIEIDIDRLSPNMYQPRGQVDDARLDELARSIKSNGIIQPIVVRKVGDRFSNHRWRAPLARGASCAGLLRVPVIVRDVAAGQERSLLEMALIENIQRENLNPIEEALAYRRLADDFSSRRKRSRSRSARIARSVANTLRLLKLPPEVRAEVVSGALSMGHARALLALTAETEQLRVARDVIARESVGPGNGVSRQETRRGSEGPARGNAPSRRRAHPGGRRAAPARPGHPGPDRPARRRRADRDRFRLRRRS